MPFITLPPRTYTVSLATGQLTSESAAAATIRMIKVGSEKVLVRSQKTFPSPSFWRCENLFTDTDTLSTELDTGITSSISGPFAPLSGGLYAQAFLQGGFVQVGVIDPSGTAPVVDTAYINTSAAASSPFMAKYEMISNGSNKMFLTWQEEPNPNDFIRYQILDWNGTAITVDESGTLQGGASLYSTHGMETVDNGTSAGIMSWTGPSSTTNIETFTFNGTFASTGTLNAGIVPGGDLAEQQRFVIFNSSDAGWIQRNSSGNVAAYKLGNLTGTPTISTGTGTMFTTFNRVGLTKIDSTRGLVFYRKDVSTISYYIVDFAPATPTFGSESTITAASIGADFFTDDIDAVYLDDGRIVIGNVADIGAAPNEIFYYVLDSL